MASVMELEQTAREAQEGTHLHFWVLDGDGTGACKKCGELRKGLPTTNLKQKSKKNGMK